MQIYWLLILLWLCILHSGYSSEVNVEKYIAESYFHDHGSLNDSEFEEFIMNKLPFGSCQMLHDMSNVVPSRVLSLDRHLIGEGSHRRLSSFIRIDLGSVVAPQAKAWTWEVIMVERLPSGVFADPFELQHLVHRGVFDEAAVFGDTNLELPSFRSNRSLVEIHRKVDFREMAGDKGELELHVHLPLHARYQPLGHDGFSRIKFGRPDLFVLCRYEVEGMNRNCLMPTNYNPVSRAADIVWEVPHGIKEHATVVSAVTFISAIVSALLIVFTSVYHSHTFCNEVKQS